MEEDAFARCRRATDTTPHRGLAPGTTRLHALGPADNEMKWQHVIGLASVATAASHVAVTAPINEKTGGSLGVAGRAHVRGEIV